MNSLGIYINELREYAKDRLRHEFDTSNSYFEKRQLIDKALHWGFGPLATEMESDMKVYNTITESDKPPDEKLQGWLDF